MPALEPVFREYVPPSWLRHAVECLLSTVPPGYLLSLSKVVLTDSASIRKGKTQRIKGQKYVARECRGFYLAATERWPASLTVVVDNVFRGTPSYALRIPVVREILLAGTLYHEIGHHLERTIGAPARAGEAAAEAWSKRLSRQHLWRRHRLASGLFWVVTPVTRIILRRYGSGKTKRAA